MKIMHHEIYCKHELFWPKKVELHYIIKCFCTNNYSGLSLTGWLYSVHVSILCISVS